MRDPATPAEIERVLVQRIEDLDGSAYRYNRAAPPRWKQSKVALAVVSDASELHHLAFNIWTERVLNTGDESGAIRNGYLWAVADVRVAFVFRIRPPKQVEDARLASDAALDIVRTFMTDWGAGHPCVNVDIPPGGEIFSTALTTDGEWVQVSLAFLARFELRLDPTPTSTPPNPIP